MSRATRHAQGAIAGNLRSVAWTSPQPLITYGVDALGRRVSKLVGGVVSRAWAWDGARIVAELDASGAVVSRFVYGTTGHVPDYMTSGANTYRLLKDHLGSVRLVVRVADGTIVQAIDYDPWGNVLSDSAPGFQPFGFAGGMYDYETRLVRFGARDYDPETGTWTAKDPGGFSGGSNLYGYAFGDPVNYIDIDGQLAQFAIPVYIGAGAIFGAATNGLFYYATHQDNGTARGMAGALVGGFISGASSVTFGWGFVGGLVAATVENAIGGGCFDEKFVLAALVSGLGNGAGAAIGGKWAGLPANSKGLPVGSTAPLVLRGGDSAQRLGAQVAREQWVRLGRVLGAGAAAGTWANIWNFGVTSRL